MANQNPQPEIYTTTHAFASSATAGTQNIQTVFIVLIVYLNVEPTQCQEILFLKMIL